MRAKRRLTRKQFEMLFAGDFVPKEGGRIRVNGQMKTYVRDGWKYLSNGELVVRARTWFELGKLLEAGRSSVNSSSSAN